MDLNLSESFMLREAEASLFWSSWRGFVVSQSICGGRSIVQRRNESVNAFCTSRGTSTWPTALVMHAALNIEMRPFDLHIKVNLRIVLSIGRR